MGMCLISAPAALLMAQVNTYVVERTNVQTLGQLAAEWKTDYEANLEEAKIEAGKRDLAIRDVSANGVIVEIVGITERGELLYNTTENLDAARTTSTDDVWPGGSLGFSLSGDSMVVGEWDGGGVRGTHQELSSRVTQVDNPSSIENHPSQFGECPREAVF